MAFKTRLLIMSIALLFLIVLANFANRSNNVSTISDLKRKRALKITL